MRVAATRVGAGLVRRDDAGRIRNAAGRTMRPCRAPVSCARQIPAVVVPWFRGSSTMSHAIPSRLFQTLKSHRWNCNVYGLCLKMTVLNYLRLFWGERRKGASHRQRGRAHDAAGHTDNVPGRVRIRSPSPRPRCPRPRPSRRTNRTPRRSRGSRPRSGSGPPGSPGSRRSRHAGTRPRTPDS